MLTERVIVLRKVYVRHGSTDIQIGKFRVLIKSLEEILVELITTPNDNDHII